MFGKVGILYVKNKVILPNLKSITIDNPIMLYLYDLSMFICNLQDLPDIFIPQLHSISLTHVHILLDRYLSVPAAVCLVKQLTQRWTNIILWIFTDFIFWYIQKQNRMKVFSSNLVSNIWILWNMKLKFLNFLFYIAFWLDYLLCIRRQLSCITFNLHLNHHTFLSSSISNIGCDDWNHPTTHVTNRKQLFPQIWHNSGYNNTQPFSNKVKIIVNYYRFAFGSVSKSDLPWSVKWIFWPKAEI